VGLTLRQVALKPGKKKAGLPETLIIIHDVDENGTAAKYGSYQPMSGDALTSVDGRSTAGQSLATVSKWLLGQPRTRVSLELHRILPNGKTDKLQLQIPRGEPRAAAKKARALLLC